ncbi:nitrogen regulatory protein pii [Lucifera butyrica]|uniref:Nitrogen regulatory protein pii n=1 Tax=Lucifera butyrica TaxID=1351585 RepID=A0A498RDC3_9FIRM|nr:P-II family nitrogen regulator [Lucifera butyrica]VBB09554.1 nitrogen regulatory protein pii [Lucifera butyrica]
MKMIRAMVRPEKAEDVADGLEVAGYYALTKMNVVGRGKQKGIIVGNLHYDEIPKVMFMMVVEDETVDEVIKIVNEKAFTGNFGDGKIFISPVEKAVTIRTNQVGL